MVQHIVLAYSGGLDTSILVHWLKHHHNAKLTAVLVDMGQSAASIDAAKQRALANGADAFVAPKALDAFVYGPVAAAIKANAAYEGVYPLATALARPVIAETLVAVARDVGADAIAHGCTGKGNDQVRIEAGVRMLAPDLVVLAPQRTDPMNREEALAYAAAHELALPAASNTTYSVDENIWGRSAEGSDLEDPGQPVPEAAFAWTVAPQQAPAGGVQVTLDFQAGLPVALDGIPLALPSLIAQLNDLAGAHGVGRIDHVENRLVGIKSREVYEAPAAIAILAAKQALESLTLTRQESRLKAPLEAAFADMVYDGLWSSPGMPHINAFLNSVSNNVSGAVTLQLRQGHITIQGRTSEVSLYDEALATYGAADAFHHQAAGGFIELWGLPHQSANAVRAQQLPKSHADAAAHQDTAASTPLPGATA